MENFEQRIIDRDGNRFLVHEYQSDDIVDYKRHLLAIGACECFLPAHFIDSNDGVVTGFYRIDGFVSFEEWLSQQESINEEPATRLCNIFCMILRRLMEAEDLFLDLDDLFLDVNSVFVDPKKGHVKLAYQSRGKTQHSLQKSILALLISTTVIANDEQWNVYCEEICRQTMGENLGLRGILKRTTEQSRHILERKWPERTHLRVGMLGEI